MQIWGVSYLKEYTDLSLYLMLYDFFKERVFIRDAFYIIYIVQLLTSGLGGGIGEDKRTRGERIRIMYNFDDFY